MLKRYPCPSWQTRRRRTASCARVSMPSPVIRSLSDRPRAQMDAVEDLAVIVERLQGALGVLGALGALEIEPLGGKAGRCQHRGHRVLETNAHEWRAETLTAGRSGMGKAAASRQRRVSSTKWPSVSMSPLSSAIEMKQSGPIAPPFGFCQRTRPRRP